MTGGDDIAEYRSSKLWQLMLWTLRLTVALQCVGDWRWLTQIAETPLLHWMLDPADVGGLAIRESTALAVQQTVGWLVLVAGGSVLWRPHVAVLAALAALQTLMTIAMWRIAAGYCLQASWAPPQLLTLFPFATHLGRIVAPLGLLLLSRTSRGGTSAVRRSDQRRIERTMQLLRAAAAIVFLAHGIEAWQQNPIFVDLLLNSAQRLFGLSIAQSTAEQCLTVIGTIDMVLAAACVSLHWVTLLWWMAAWGGITAISRSVANGWEVAWHEVLTRSPHFGLPLAVALWWHLLEYQAATATAVDDDRNTAPGNSKVSHSSRNRRTPLLWFVFLLATVIVCGPTAPAKADAVLEGANPAQWRLVWTGDPATSATLCWNTAVAGEQHRLHLRREGHAQESAAETAEETASEITSAGIVSESVDHAAVVIAAQRNGRYSARSPDLYFHHVQLNQLEPATKYQVVLESDGQRSPPLFFVTAPDQDVPLSLLFGADSRSGHEARRQMNMMLANMVRESHAAGRVPILALAHGGDFVYDGRDLGQWSRWMSDHELTTGSEGRLLPIIPARGNHDGGKLFNEVFAFPPEDENYYSIDIGPQIRLITLNTETSLSGDQLNWLKAELAASRGERRWLLAQYHRPAFPAVKRFSLSLVHWVPLFEEYNVDLVCEGDGHNIKRTAPIRDYQIDPTGIVYIGEGGLGVGQRTPKPHRWYLNSPLAKTGQGHHVQLLTFDREQLGYRVILLGGKMFDEHYLPVRRHPVSKDSG